MQIIYIKKYTETVQQILGCNLKPEQYSVQRIQYPETVYSVMITDEITPSQLALLKRVLHDYSVDETRVRDWLGY